MHARATMLVERSVFQRCRKKGGRKRQQATVNVAPEITDVDIEETKEDDDDGGSDKDPMDGGPNAEETDEQVDKADTTTPSDDGKEWVKSVDSDLRTFLENKGAACRCYFLDKFFDNPPHLPGKAIIVTFSQSTDLLLTSQGRMHV